ncbi:MAG: hypothetical protein NT155_03785 [Candidatus Staskawiczbacteria bacterium]|nr:hypothetical protein [Candidatus Staskawiczbacteria bacterium]
MNKIIRSILIVLAVLAIVASIAGNVYYFGWLNLQNSLMQKGYNTALQQVIQAVQAQGLVKIGDYTLILQPKK